MPIPVSLRRPALALAATALALTAAGCGSSATKASPSPTAPTPAASTGDGSSAQFEALLTEEGVEEDAAFAVVTASTSVTDDQAALSVLHTQWVADDAAFRTLHLTGQAATDLPAMLSTNASYEAGVARATAQGDTKSLQDSLNATVTGEIDRTKEAAAVTHDLGLPVKEVWFEEQPAGTPVYQDDFSRPGTFATGQGATEADGALTIVYGHGSVSTGEAGTHAFDGRNTATQVSMTLPSASSDVRGGLLCPNTGKKLAVGAGLQGDGKWALFNYDFSDGATTIFNNGDLPAGSGLTHTVRLDCEQYAASTITARLYVDGSVVGSSSLGGQLPADETQPDAFDPAILVVNSGTAPATFTFHDFSVATLPAPSAPPVPFSA